MISPQSDYIGRLPYGYWFGPVQNREYLFDRSYHAIASRAIDVPWKVTVYPERKYIDAGKNRFQLYYYNDGSSPRRHEVTLRICERVLARFISGRDVRAWLENNKTRPPLATCLFPQTGGRYLPEMIPRDLVETELTVRTPSGPRDQKWTPDAEDTLEPSIDALLS